VSAVTDAYHHNALGAKCKLATLTTSTLLELFNKRENENNIFFLFREN
jgi:hypothetical protein